MKHQCILCGKKTSVKEWRCECRTLWHTCRIHRYAKANDLPLSKQINATIGHSSPVENPDVKRAKINIISPDLGRNEADELSAGTRKRKISSNESDRPNEDEDATLDSRISLKRKRNQMTSSILEVSTTINLISTSKVLH